MKRTLLGTLLGAWCLVAQAHFGMVIPSQPVVMDQAQSKVDLEIAFAHPMERSGMTMAKPRQVFVSMDGKKTDLTTSLKPATTFGAPAWTTSFDIKRPGVYQFVVEPEPYWEGTEDRFMQSIAKVYVPAYGADDGWEAPLGLKAEILPYVRPFGNWAGMSFTGKALLDGKPVPNAHVAITYLNKDDIAIENPYYHWQVVNADENGNFTVSIPFEGWWGFAAVNDLDEPLMKDGQPKVQEVDAVLWTYFAKRPK